MIKHSNRIIKPQKVDYQILVNFWIDDTKRLEIVKTLMITDRFFKLSKLKTNPVYIEVYNSLILDNEKKLKELDNSIFFSRKFTKKMFYAFSGQIIVFGFFVFFVICYQMRKNLYYYHAKYGVKTELLSVGPWKIDFSNKEMYPDKAILAYFENKKKEEFNVNEEQKALKYSELFIKNISTAYLSDYYKRRKYLGFNDEEE